MTLFILSTKPYDGSDNIYGALRLVKKLVEMKQEVRQHGKRHENLSAF